MGDVSESLQSFIDEAPHARGPHVAFLQRAAQSLADGETVLDVGAGEAPYREFFSHVRYLTSDRVDSTYRPTVPIDFAAPADELPFKNGEIDAIICTQVLEHVPEPRLVLDEFHRVLRSGGRVWITAPMTWYLHEEPRDYYRYTSHGLRFLLERSGFVDIEIAPLNNSFDTVAQLVEHLGWMMGRGNDGFDDQRGIVAKTMLGLAGIIESFGNFDTRWVLPISHSAIATRRDDS